MIPKTIDTLGYHASADYQILSDVKATVVKQVSQFTYTFENFFHPYVGELIERLNQRSLAGMLDPAFHEGLSKDLFDTFYKVATSTSFKVEHRPWEIDVGTGGPYANYNWELLFHIPLAIAVHLSRNQRFAEAQRWFHYIFDPTSNETSVPTPQRYWRFIAFRHGEAGRSIEELLALLSKPNSACTSAEIELKGQILEGYAQILATPFQPHAVARTRPLAYMYSVVMKYLDNLIAWGDSLFRQDTLETINEATQIYVLASNILGERPQQVPRKGTVRPQTFAQLKARGLDALGNALVELEGQFPLNFGVPSGTSASDASGPLFGLGRTLYFCVPRNDKMLSYWDTVADRLFKIRHCMNIEGVVRPLALFDPPLDPGMLVKAAAAGLDIGSIVAGLNQPTSPVRSRVLIQKALELSAEVRGLGAALLQAIEKGDAERLAVLRQGHEVALQRMQLEVRFLQWKQAQEATTALLRTRAVALERYRYYLRLLGGQPDGALVPENLPLDRRELTEENFDETYAALVERYEREVPLLAYPKLKLAGGSPAGDAGAAGPGKLSLNSEEDEELSHLGTARDLGLAASIVDATGSALAFIPDAKGNLHFWGLGGTIDIRIGTAIQKVVEISAKILQMTSAWHREQAGIAGRTASYARRADDWTLQANLAGRELRQLGRQVISSLISEQAARREYVTVQKQIDQSQQTERFLLEKFSNAELYAWMQGELSRLYYEYYRFAFDLARRAETTMKRELMRPELDARTLIQFNYWDGGRKGLLSGEALHLDVKRMEMAYHEHNLREYELTRNVSLLQVDPLALIQLRASGRCTVRLPEALFDLDGPGHYFRRIRSVALTVPCVSGPYVGVACKLTLLRSSIRTSTLPGAGYPREGAEDGRFLDQFGSVESIVASTAQQDSGLFESNVRDDRYLPFENAGVISEWQLELPGDPSQGDPTQFDYETISDVVLHVRYTAREGGAPLRAAAVQALKDLIDAAQSPGSTRLFSIRHEFPSEWARFRAQVPGANQRRALTLSLRPEHYPFWSQGRIGTVQRIDLFVESALDTAPATLTVADRADMSDASSLTDTLTKSASLDGLLTGKLSKVPLPAPTGERSLYLEDGELSDLWMAVTFGA